MARAVTMPKLGQSEEQATVVRWNKREGDPIARGDILFEIETDKAVLEVESYFDGTLLKILAPEGATVPVLSVVAYIGQPDEAIPESEGQASQGGPTKAAGSSPPAPSPAPAPERRAAADVLPSAGRPITNALTAPGVAAVPASLPVAATAEQHFLRISPRAARLARESLIDPSGIRGTGPGGRIIERDVRAYLAEKHYERLRISPAARELAAREKIDILAVEPRAESGRIEVADIERVLAERPVPLSRMRQIIAARMAESTATAPHFFVTVSADVTELEALRLQLKGAGQVYSLTDFVLKAVALALRDFPLLNATTDGKNVWRHAGVHLGVAVSLDGGLVVPVIRHADALSLAGIHERAGELTARARAGKLTPEEMRGSTFTISNMGMLDVENFTAIINPGESAILAVASARRQPAVQDERIEIRSLMKMTLSSDHRLIDGALAARFLNAVRANLEETALWKRLT